MPLRCRRRPPFPPAVRAGSRLPHQSGRPWLTSSGSPVAVLVDELRPREFRGAPNFCARHFCRNHHHRAPFLASQVAEQMTCLLVAVSSKSWNQPVQMILISVPADPILTVAQISCRFNCSCSRVPALALGLCLRTSSVIRGAPEREQLGSL